MAHMHGHQNSSRRSLVVDEGAGGKGTKHCRAFLVEGNAVETAAESAAAERDAESDLERSAERDAVPGVWLKTTRTAHVSEPSMAHRTATIGSFEPDAGDNPLVLNLCACHTCAPRRKNRYNFQREIQLTPELMHSNELVKGRLSMLVSPKSVAGLGVND